MLAGFFFLPKPQKWSLLVTAMQKVTSEHLKIFYSSSPWRIVMLYFSVGSHNFIPINRDLPASHPRLDRGSKQYNSEEGYGEERIYILHDKSE
jgi:hypothetical protein